MPSEHTARDREPAHGPEAEGAGSLVVGIDPQRVEDLRRRFREVGEGLAGMRSALQPAVQALRLLHRVDIPEPMSQYDAGDAMRWSPPSEGEETPPCPA